MSDLLTADRYKNQRHLLPWLRHIATSPPGSLHLAVAQTQRIMDNDVIRPLREVAEESSFKYRTGASVMEVFGQRVYPLVASDPRSERKMLAMLPWAVLITSGPAFPLGFISMIEYRMSREGSRIFWVGEGDE